MAKKTLVTFVLDETGSMQSIKDDTIGGFNAFIESLKESREDFVFTLIKFDSNKQDVIYSGVPIQIVPELTPETYQPGAATPLIDACMKAIQDTALRQEGYLDLPEDENLNIMVVIQTDGYENASEKYKNADLVNLIKEKTEQGWVFSFIGAGIDAFDQASQLGISPLTTVSYGRSRSAYAFSGVAQSAVRYASSGGSITKAAFTDEERKAMEEDDDEITVLGSSTTDEPASG